MGLFVFLLSLFHWNHSLPFSPQNFLLLTGFSSFFLNMKLKLWPQKPACTSSLHLCIGLVFSGLIRRGGGLGCTRGESGAGRATAALWPPSTPAALPSCLCEGFSEAIIASGLSELFPHLQDVFRGPRQVLRSFLWGNGGYAAEVRGCTDPLVHEEESAGNACLARGCVWPETLTVLR